MTVLTEMQREMVVANLALVEHIVNRVGATLPSTYARDDLVQTGILGLISATVRFDPANGTAFSTFAGRRIEGAIIDMLRQGDWAPRSVRSQERRLSAASGTVASTQGRPEAVTAQRLCRELGMTPQQLDRIRADIDKARVDSLDRPVNTDGAVIPLASTVFDPGIPVEDNVDNAEMIGYLRDGVALLPERHRMVVVGFFFEGRSMTELGELLGVTQSRASQLKDEAIRMLRAGLDQVYGDRPTAEPPPTSRQKRFNEALASSRPWRDRIAAGHGFSAVAPADRINVRS